MNFGLLLEKIIDMENGMENGNFFIFILKFKTITVLYVFQFWVDVNTYYLNLRPKLHLLARQPVEEDFDI